LLILGCGALAREIALAIPTTARHFGREEFTVIVAARDAARAAWIARLGCARSHAARAPVKFIHLELDWNDIDKLATVVKTAAPTVILNAASLQSAWSLTAANAWSELVKKGGYGVTAALQAALLPQLGRALQRAHISAPVINACYPDVVNAGGLRMGIEIFSGIGNIALIAELLRQHLAESNFARLHLLAGHWDVNQFMRPPTERSDLPQVWGDESTLPLEAILGAPLLAGDVTLNAFGAGLSASLLYSVATRSDWTGHVPGPQGELGGYPVALRAGTISVDLPRGLTLDAARAWNFNRCERDGAVVESGARLYFSDRAAHLLSTVAPRLAEGFDFRDVETVAEDFIELRASLMQRPSCALS